MKTGRRSAKIHTPALDLLPCDLTTMDIVLENDPQKLGSHLGVEVRPGWSEYGLEPFRWTRDTLAVQPDNRGWLTYLIVHFNDNRLIGTCGFKGKPDAAGYVEIGYEIIPEYRLQGLATEVARSLVERAFKYAEVTAVLAHTLPTDNPSTSVLRKAGLNRIGKVVDPDEGAVWRWRITQAEFRYRGR
ncbi:MAG: GNAT family N-acetyltransferase [Bacteroidota bacterium]